MRRAFWTFALTVLTAAAATAAAPRDDITGQTRTHVIVEQDTLVDLARDNDLGYIEIIAANPGVDPWLPTPGTRILLPSGHLLPDAPRRGIVINLPDQRLYFFAPDKPLQSFPIGVAAGGIPLRTGTTRVIAKRVKPVWFPTPSERAEDQDLPASVPPGPDNPLGEFGLYTDWTGIVIHGTNKPYGIGRRVSHGCFRLYPEDIEVLFKETPVGTPVTVVDQPAKIGWVDDKLYLEVHPTLAEAEELVETGTFTPAPIAGLDRLVLEAASPFPEEIDWQAVDRAARERTGVPTLIFKSSDTLSKAQSP